MKQNVDILLATYNGEKYLKAQLDSIIAQDYKDFNLIISDDASTDSTCEILKEYEKKDKRITVIYNTTNMGSNKNFEFLLSQIKSEYYMFCDQDDVWKKDKVRLSIECIKKSNADLVYTDLEVVDENLKTINPSFNRKMKLIKKQKKYTDFRLEYLYNCVTGCTIIAKSSVLDSVLPFPNNSDILHDYWIALVTSLNGKIVYLDVPTIKYRQHSFNQVGTSRYTSRFDDFDEKRDYIIKLKIDKFDTYIQKETYFPQEIKKLNKDALEYFKIVKDKKNINLKKWNIFFKVFKYETFGYKLFYFFFYNFACIYRAGYNLYKKMRK